MLTTVRTLRKAFGDAAPGQRSNEVVVLRAVGRKNDRARIEKLLSEAPADAKVALIVVTEPQPNTIHFEAEFSGWAGGFEKIGALYAAIDGVNAGMKR